MKRSLMLVLGLALVLAVSFISVTQARPAQEAERVEVVEVSEKVDALFAAGGMANQQWHALSQADQADITRFLFPVETAQGERFELMGVYDYPVADSPSKPSSAESQPPSWCSGLYVVRNGNNPTGRTNGPWVEGYGGSPAGTSMSLLTSRSVSNSFSANVGVSSGPVSAGVGFNVTASTGVEYSYSINIPYRQRWRIQAYNRFNGTGFDVWDDDCGDPPDTFRGRGTAWRYSGVYYTSWRVY